MMTRAKIGWMTIYIAVAVSISVFVWAFYVDATWHSVRWIIGASFLFLGVLGFILKEE